MIRPKKVTKNIILLLKQWDSVRDSVCVYISSFFIIQNWKYFEKVQGNPFQCLIDLWNKGFVPSFDGNTWRLHSGKKAEIVYTILKEDLQKI